MNKLTQKFLLVGFFSLLSLQLIKAQNYTIGCYTKIDNQTGNLDQQLNSGGQFGYSIDNIGDLNKDGIDDLVVGAFTDDDGGKDRGAVYILFMGADDEVKSSQKISSTEGNFTGVLDDNDVFGASVTYLGDMNNDGFIEIAVGAEYDGDGGYWHGAVWIISLYDAGTVMDFSKISDYEGGFTGTFNGDVVFGTDVENVGDLDNDGIEDIIVSARRDSDGYDEAGAIWILYLNNDFSVKNYKKISETEGGFSGNLSTGDYFGGAVAGIADLDGDGINEIAVGAYRDDDGGTDYGSLYILFLNANGDVKKEEKISFLEGGSSFDLNNNAIFGKSIDGYSDIDSDGLIEILVGCARCNNPNGGGQTGVFYLIELNNDGTVNQKFSYSYNLGGFTGNLSSGDHFGMSLSYLKNQDPLKIAVGAPKDGAGAIWILNFEDQLSSVTIEPISSSCSGSTGILFSDLLPDSNYVIELDHNGSEQEYSVKADENGELKLSDLPQGDYTNFKVKRNGCQFDSGQTIQIKSNPVLEPEFTAVSGSCENSSGNSIKISSLPANTSFSIKYHFNGAPASALDLTSNAAGEVTVSSLEAGEYSDFELSFNNCEESFDVKLVLDGGAFSLPEINFSRVSLCGADNGSIEFSNLSPSVSYNFSFLNDNSQIITKTIDSNENGEAIISGLSGGIYSDFIIKSSSCEHSLEQEIDLNSVEVYEVEVLQEPDCGAGAGGRVELKNLLPNTEFTLNYKLHGQELNYVVWSDESGIIQIEDLAEGAYDQIRLILSDCEIYVDDFTLSCKGSIPLCYEYPKFFTPNSDGYSDDWKVRISEANCDKNFKCYIFDRYGKLIKVLNGPEEAWNGNFNGKPMPADDYWIRLEFPDVQGFMPETTHISLIR